MAEKIDFKKTIDSYRAIRGAFRLLEVPPLQYLMIDGSGDPNTVPEYAEAVRALYPLAYALKFLSKRQLGKDYTVMPLEGLWWADDMESFTSARDKSRWSWTMMIMVPDWISQDVFAEVLKSVTAKNPAASLAKVRLETLAEGSAVQTLHIGPYDDEGPVLAKMHREFIPEQRLTLTGKHHEIYLSDPRRTAPEKLRTLLRQPVLLPSV